MAKLHSGWGFGGLLGCSVGLWACGHEDPGVRFQAKIPVEGDSEFTSVRDANSSGFERVAEEASADSQSGRDQSETVAYGGAERAVAEADILQLSGDRLYALSRYRGLTVIDASDPARLLLLGEYRAAAEPFEMYVEDGLVYAMFNGWYSYVCDEQSGACQWQAESRMQAIDTRDAANIRVIADLEVPGYIADSRRVGDVLYLATEQSGYCWRCEPQANTTVTSFDLSTPGRFSQLDQLRLPLPAGREGGGRSVFATNQRLYIAGYEYDTVNFLPVPSGVQVVDISDPGGALEAGARFDVAGGVQSRWQMDEFEGVFRAVSQPGNWGSDQPPVLQTFRVNTSSDVQPLASLTVRLPRPNEVLQSARFDGSRGYLITAERRDPLFTFDLSDPAAPRQLGELEMPGWVSHMEPRGNRVYALGFDGDNPEGSLHVSLFDVENLEQPRLLSRIAFGGDWGSFAEGQNQVHKAFAILPDQGLILVPFSGTSVDDATCQYDYSSGIQLVDFTADTLTRRGVAPQAGNARRALLHRDHLFGIGDNTVQTFDIQNRDAPVAAARVDVARNVSAVRVLGDHLMRFGSDWSTNQTVLDLTPVERAAEATPESEIDLSALFGQDAWSCGNSTYWTGQVFTRGDFAYVPRVNYRYDSVRNISSQQLTLYVVDLSDRSAPRAVGSLAVTPGEGQTYITNILQTDNTLLVGHQEGGYWGTGQFAPRYFYDVIELGNPASPSIASTFEVPAQIAGQGWGYFAVGGCSVDMGWGWYGQSESAELTEGDLVISQHAEPVEGDASRRRYFLDRIDVSDPYQPRMLPSVNIPGTVIQFDAARNELVTIDYQVSIEQAENVEECYARGYYGSALSWRSCSVTRRSLNALALEGERAVLRSRVELDANRRTSNIAVSDNRIFYTSSELATASDVLADRGEPSLAENPAPRPIVPVLLESLTRVDGVLTALPAHELRRLPRGMYYYSQLLARGERAFEIYDNSVTVIDTIDPEAPTRLEHEMPGWGCQSLEVAGDAAYCASGERGVETIDLSAMR